MIFFFSKSSALTDRPVTVNTVSLEKAYNRIGNNKRKELSRLNQIAGSCYCRLDGRRSATRWPSPSTLELVTCAFQSLAINKEVAQVTWEWAPRGGWTDIKARRDGTAVDGRGLAGLGTILCVSVAFRSPLLFDCIRKLEIGRKLKKREGDFITENWWKDTFTMLISAIESSVLFRYATSFIRYYKKNSIIYW